MLKRSLLVLLLAAFAASSVPISAAQPHDVKNKRSVYHPKAKAKARKQVNKKPAPKVTKKVVKKKVVTRPEPKKG